MTGKAASPALFGVVFICLFAAGCQETGQPLAAGGSSPSTEYILLEREGGIAGERQMIRVSGGGHVRIRDRRRNVDVTRKLSEAQVSELFRLLAEANENASDAAGKPPVAHQCADCIEVRLRWDTSGGTGKRQLRGPQAGESAYATLVERLYQRIRAAAPD